MGSSKKSKFKKSITLKELPQHLRNLASMLEKGKVPTPVRDVQLNEIETLKVSFKYRNYVDIIETKITIESAEVGIMESGDSSVVFQTLFMNKKGKLKKPSYKKLKKSMGIRFDQIKELISSGTLPDAETVGAFYSECEAMTLFPDKGDEYYEDFLYSVRLLNEAIEARSLDSARKAMERIDYIKDACHKRYK